MAASDPGHHPGSSRTRGSRRRRVWAVTAAIVGVVTVLALAIPAGLRYVRDSGTAPGPWPPAPRAGVDVVDIDSPALGRSVPGLVWTPEGTTPDSRLPVVLLFHGQGGDPSVWFHALGADLEAADLIAEGRIPPVLLVSAGIGNSMGIDSVPADDGYDNGAWGTYLADDVIPWIAERYPISTDPRDHVAGGLSMGGFAALHLAFGHPERFGGVGGLSPAVALDIQPERAWMYRDEADRDANDPQRLAATVPLDDMRVFLGAGATDYDWIIEGTQLLADTLAARDVPVMLADPPSSGHDGQTWQALTRPMLEWLLAHRG
jgi:enterochelin esterase-like enzyme